MWGLLELPQFRGATHADNYDNRSRPRQVGLPGPWRRCRWPVVIRRQLKRRTVQKLPPCLVGIEACVLGLQSCTKVPNHSCGIDEDERYNRDEHLNAS
jgi:hypothetical protein